MPGYLCVHQVPPNVSCVFQHDEAGAGHLLRQMIGAADAGDAGADDQHVEMFDCLRGGRKVRAGALDVHLF